MFGLVWGAGVRDSFFSVLESYSTITNFSREDEVRS